MRYSNRKSDIKISRIKQLGLMVCMIPSLALSQEEIIVFHNCENLFYPQNDTLTQDDDFTIEGKKHWTFKKYNTKLNALAKTYISIDDKLMPALIGMAEVENDTVLRALTRNTPLRSINYQFIHYPSPDIRGIDVALLYNPKKFTPKEHYTLRATNPNSKFRTRDVLYVRGLLNKLPLNIYVVHAPSRREHNLKKDLRAHIFQHIYRHIDSLMQMGEKNFIIMGDMNDNPWDKTIEDNFLLNRDNSILFALMQNNKGKTGSYVYSGTTLCFDQFLVTKSIQERLCFTPTCNQSFIYKPSFLIKQDKNSRVEVPFSTYNGMQYQGGISDHFPILMRLNTKL